MKRRNKKPLWIAFSGLDGSGKTTAVMNLCALLENMGYSVKRDRLPHDPYITKTLLDKSKDDYTDRLLFAVDNRIFATELDEMIKSNKYDFIVTQRCFLDSFVHGAVQGFSYSWVEELNRISKLPRTDIIIHMVAKAETAYNRIRDDKDADKFEYPAYIRKQEVETRRAYAECISGKNIDLEPFNNATHIYVDTTNMTTDEVFQYVKEQLEKLHIF